MDKKQLRKELLAKRRNIHVKKKVIFDKEISNTIIHSEYFKNAQQILVFASVNDEFDTGYIIEHCRGSNKQLFFPLCTDRNGNMEFFKVESESDLRIGMYNIPEPKPTCKKYETKENDLIIVPCLSADRTKNRIGYGKGYYDRFLKNFNGVSICPCYSEMLTDILPTDENDIKTDIIVTDKEVIR